MVVGQATGDPEHGDPEGLAPIVVFGGRFEGYLGSDSTQRDGIVTNLDVTATILEELGVERPVAVLGNPMRGMSTDSTVEQRVSSLSVMNSTAVSVDKAKPGVVNTFVSLSVLALLLTAFVLVRAGNWRPVFRRRAGASIKAVLLLILGVPVSGWLMFGLKRFPESGPQAAIALIVTALAVWAVSLFIWWLSRGRVAVAFICLLTAMVIMVDQLFGAPASFTNFFGYSPLLAARFYGMGNEAAAILFGAAITGLALLFDEWPTHTGVSWGKRLGIPLMGIAVVLAAAAPWLGANVGVAIWGVVGFGLAWVVMNGHHVSWKSIFWLALLVVLTVVAFAAIDVFGGQQTHLAQALGSAEKGGAGELWAIVVRKAETNARVLTRTNWAYILVATLAFLGLQRWRPHGDFAETLTENPHFADAITVSLVAGLVAYFTEDSGVVIPALAVFYIGVALSWLMLSRLTEQSRQPALDDNASER